MRRLVWAVILIPLLIGVVIAANTLVTQSGFIRVVAPGLVWVGSPPVFPNANFTRPLIGSSNYTTHFQIMNNGQLSLKLTETFLGNGSSLFERAPLNGVCLAVGVARQDGLNLIITNTTAIGYYVLEVQIGYSALGC